MGTTHDTQTRIAMATSALAGLELGSVFTSARAVIYSADNTVLAIFPMAQPAFPPMTAVDVASNVIQNALAAASGDAHHFALLDRNGTPRIFGAIGLSGSGAEIEMAEDPNRPGNVTPTLAGQPCAISNIVYRAPI